MLIAEDVEDWLEDSSELKTALVLMIESSFGTLAASYFGVRALLM
jgi:hypothetical protein